MEGWRDYSLCLDPHARPSYLPSRNKPLNNSAAMKRIIVLVVLLSAPISGSAQDKPKPWSYSGRLTAVWTGGNSEASTFGLGSTIRHVANKNELKLEANGVRTESSRKTRRAVGTVDAFRVEEDKEWQKTAEAYYARARYDRTVSSGSIVFGGVDWLRNTFAGIDSRI